MPVLQLSEKTGNGPFIGETEFVLPENEAEQVKMYIHLASVSFVNDALQVSSLHVAVHPTSAVYDDIL